MREIVMRMQKNSSRLIIGMCFFLILLSVMVMGNSFGGELPVVRARPAHSPGLACVVNGNPGGYVNGQCEQDGGTCNAGDESGKLLTGLCIANSILQGQSSFTNDYMPCTAILNNSQPGEFLNTYCIAYSVISTVSPGLKCITGGNQNGTVINGQCSTSGSPSPFGSPSPSPSPFGSSSPSGSPSPSPSPSGPNLNSNICSTNTPTGQTGGICATGFTGFGCFNDGSGKCTGAAFVTCTVASSTSTICDSSQINSGFACRQSTSDTTKCVSGTVFSTNGTSTSSNSTLCTSYDQQGNCLNSIPNTSHSVSIQYSTCGLSTQPGHVCKLPPGGTPPTTLCSVNPNVPCSLDNGLVCTPGTGSENQCPTSASVKVDAAMTTKGTLTLQSSCTTSGNVKTCTNATGEERCSPSSLPPLSAGPTATATATATPTPAPTPTSTLGGSGNLYCIEYSISQGSAGAPEMTGQTNCTNVTSTSGRCVFEDANGKKVGNANCTFTSAKSTCLIIFSSPPQPQNDLIMINRVCQQTPTTQTCTMTGTEGKTFTVNCAIHGWQCTQTLPDGTQLTRGSGTGSSASCTEADYDINTLKCTISQGSAIIRQNNCRPTANAGISCSEFQSDGTTSLGDLSCSGSDKALLNCTITGQQTGQTLTLNYCVSYLLNQSGVSAPCSPSPDPDYCSDSPSSSGFSSTSVIKPGDGGCPSSWLADIGGIESNNPVNGLKVLLIFPLSQAQLLDELAKLGYTSSPSTSTPFPVLLVKPS